jgi:hypothetical protein
MPSNLKLRTNSSQCIDVVEIQVRFILFHITAGHLKLLAIDVHHDNPLAPCAGTQAATMPP